MVYNPPVERGEDGEPIKDGGVAVTHPVNPMRRGAYVEQATRATAWAAMYIVGWLLMRLSCYAGLPDDCNLPDEPLEVLTVLLVLLVFSLAQVRAERDGDSVCRRNLASALMMSVIRRACISAIRTLPFSC